MCSLIKSRRAVYYYRCHLTSLLRYPLFHLIGILSYSLISASEKRQLPDLLFHFPGSVGKYGEPHVSIAARS